MPNMVAPNMDDRRHPASRGHHLLRVVRAHIRSSFSVPLHALVRAAFFSDCKSLKVYEVRTGTDCPVQAGRLLRAAPGLDRRGRTSSSLALSLCFSSASEEYLARPRGRTQLPRAQSTPQSLVWQSAASPPLVQISFSILKDANRA